MRTVRILALTLGPTVLVSAAASYGFAHDKSHKEMWSDPVAQEGPMSTDGMRPSFPDMAPHPEIATLGAGPMVAELGNATGARTVIQADPQGTAGAGATAASAGAAATEAERQGEQLTDEKILHVAHVANTGEIEQSKLAASRAKDPRVRRYAKMMITMHGAADKKEADVVRRRSLNMVASKTSDKLLSEGKQNVDMLKQKSGADFDHAYMDAMVSGHQEVLNIIDTRMLPNANDKDVKALVNDMRPTVQSHLDQAKDIQSKLKE